MKQSKLKCPARRCIHLHAKYPPGSHIAVGKVYDLEKAPKWAPGAIALCECCGSYYDGADWKCICIYCSKVVQPGEKTGLFWPHSCKECSDQRKAEETARGAVCNTCRNTFSWCCC